MVDHVRMHSRTFVIAALVCSIIACTRERSPAAGTATTPDHLMTAQELMAVPHRDPDHRIKYDSDSSQYGELRVPAGTGPHPLVILIHGGCWRADFATASSIGAMADALKADGVATWSIEYRRLHEPGGGWPGTYLDVGRAVDYARTLATPYQLDLSRVIVAGHSAGGHLAMWAAARSRLAKGSPLYVSNPLPLRGVVDLSGTPDMAGDVLGMSRVCGDTVVQAMVGGMPDVVPQQYAQVSAIRLLPLGVPQALVWGAHDDQVPLAVAERYTRIARLAGDRVRLVVDSSVGHFETASPRSSTWPAVHSAMQSLLDGTFSP
jgi:acetyl esterase/lipase